MLDLIVIDGASIESEFRPVSERALDLRSRFMATHGDGGKTYHLPSVPVCCHSASIDDDVSLCGTLFVPLSFTRTRMHRCKQARTQTHAQTHTLSHLLTFSLSLSHTHTHTKYQHKRQCLLRVPRSTPTELLPIFSFLQKLHSLSLRVSVTNSLFASFTLRRSTLRPTHTCRIHVAPPDNPVLRRQGTPDVHTT